MFIRTLVVFAIVIVGELLSGVSATAAAPSSPLTAGTAKVEITPSAAEAVNLVGQRLELRDPLFARVLVLQDEHVSLAIVSLDLIVFASPRVIAEAKAKWGIDHVILSATHTHAGMAPRGLVIQPPRAPDWTRSGRAPADTVDWPGLSADPWYAATEEKVIAAIGQAQQQRFPARLAAGRGTLDSAYMAHNRRLVQNGRVTMMWNNPDRRPTQPVDPRVGVLRVDDLRGKPRAVAVHYSCHPVALMGAGAVSRDYPGATVDHVEQALGPDCMALFLQGASGDIDPYDLSNLRGENRFNIAKQAGISLGKRAVELARELQPRATQQADAIRVQEEILTLPHRQGTQTTDVGVLTAVIDRELALVAIPGEPFVEHQLQLAAQSQVPHTLLLGLAYHGRGTPFVVYIPTVKAVQEGGYGATECSFLAADAGDRLVAAALGALRKLQTQP